MATGNVLLNLTVDGESAEQRHERLCRELATDFFYWWYNQPGTNTVQGFEAWKKTEQGKARINALK